MAVVANEARETRDAPGWYGKLSSLGDFAQRRLPAPWVQACDAWLSGAMRSGREQLGDRWLDVYLTAPLLRFAWAPGVVDGRWWFGLLMPSCDSVGRYFPLVIAHPRMRPPEDRIALDHLELWYEHLAQAAMGTLNDGAAAVDALEAALNDVPPWPTPGSGPAVVARQDVHSQQLRVGRDAPLSQWLHVFAAQEMVSRLAGCSVWWRVTEAGTHNAIDIVQGLPDGNGFVKLMTSNDASI